MNATVKTEVFRWRWPDWPGVAALLAIWAVFGLVPWTLTTVDALAGMLLGVVACWVAGHRAVRVDEAGVTELRWGRKPVRLLWSEISGVYDHGTCGHIVGAQAQITVDGRCRGWRRLLRRTREGIGQDEREDGTAEVSARDIAGWLGIGLDEHLLCRPRAPWGDIVASGLVAGLVTAVLAAWAALSAPYDPGIHFELVIGAGLSAALWSIRTLRLLLGRRGIRVSSAGLIDHQDGQRRHVGWDALCRLDQGPADPRRFYLDAAAYRADTRYIVATDDGQLVFHHSDRNSAALLRAVRQVIAAREAGRRLPSSGPVPDGAISRVRMSGEVEAERGISVVQAEPATEPRP